LLRNDLSGHSADVRAVVALADEGGVATSSRDGTIRIWADDGRCLSVLAAHGSDAREESGVNFVNCLAVPPAGTEVVSATETRILLASGAYNGQIFEWDDLGDNFPEPARRLAGHCDGPKEQTNVACLCYRRDGALISGGWDCKVRIHQHGELLKTIEAHTEAVWCLLPLPEGRLLTGSADKTIRLWHEEECEPQLEIRLNGAVRALHDYGDGGFLVTGNDGWLRCFDADGKQSNKVVAHEDSFVYSVAVSASQDTAYTVGEDHTLKVWETATWTCLQSILLPETVWHVATMPNADVAIGCADRHAYIWTTDPSRVCPQEVRDALSLRAEEACPAGVAQSAAQANLRKKLARRKKASGETTNKNVSKEDLAAAEAAAEAARQALLAELECEEQPEKASKSTSKKKKKKR